MLFARSVLCKLLMVVHFSEQFLSSVKETVPLIQYSFLSSVVVPFVQ